MKTSVLPDTCPRGGAQEALLCMRWLNWLRSIPFFPRFKAINNCEPRERVAQIAVLRLH